MRRIRKMSVVGVKTLSCCGGLVAVLAAYAVFHAESSQKDPAVDLGKLPEVGLESPGLNSADGVAGPVSAGSPELAAAYLAGSGVIAEIPGLANANGLANGGNDSGIVAGSFFPDNSGNGPSGPRNRPAAVAAAINGAGLNAADRAAAPMGDPHGALANGSSATDLDANGPGGPSNPSVAIDTSVAGSGLSDTQTSTYTKATTDSGSSGAGGASSSSEGIDDGGGTGSSLSLPHNGKSDPQVASVGSGTTPDLGSLGGNSSGATGLNDSGTVVGSSSLADGSTGAASGSNTGGKTGATTSIDLPAVSLSDPYVLNQPGLITTDGDPANGPVPTPQSPNGVPAPSNTVPDSSSTALLVMLGLAALAFCRPRRGAPAQGS